jgi:hypothetical protein
MILEPMYVGDTRAMRGPIASGINTLGLPAFKWIMAECPKRDP